MNTNLQSLSLTLKFKSLCLGLEMVNGSEHGPQTLVINFQVGIITEILLLFDGLNDKLLQYFTALVKLRGYDDVEEEMEEMRVEARKAEAVETFSMKKLLSSPELKLPLIIAVIMQVAQQWSGINAVSNLKDSYTN